MTTADEKALKKYEEHCKSVLRKSAINIDETPTEQSKRIQALEKVYTDWFEFYLAHYAKSKCSWYQKKIANILLKNRTAYCVLRVFRSGAKSVHCNIGIPLFLYLAMGEMNFMLLIGENEKKAKKLLSDIQAEFTSNQKLINDYGKRFQFGDWADGNFSTVDDVHFHALGMGQSPRGIRDMENRPDYISVDDIDTKKRCKNPMLVREAFEYLKEDVWGCFGAGNCRYVQSNNMFSKTSVIKLMSDHFTTVIQQYKEKKIQPNHHIVIAKAIQNDGTSGWPENYSLAHWEKKRIDYGELSFQREFQDNPIEEGTVFKNEWISFKKPLELFKYDAIVLYGDLSYKDTGDFKALLLIGKIGKEFHVIKAHVRRTSRALAARWLYDFYEEKSLQKYNIRYLVEGSFSQDMFVDDFDKEGEIRGFYIPVVADKKSKTNKSERIESMSGFFERGDIHFCLADKDTPDMVSLIDQILAFEKGSTVNDDGPDCLQSGIQELNHASIKFEIKTMSIRETLARKKNRF